MLEQTDILDVKLTPDKVEVSGYQTYSIINNKLYPGSNSGGSQNL